MKATIRTPRRLGVALAAATLALTGASMTGAAAAPAPPAALTTAPATGPFCGLWWGSLDKVTPFHYTDGTVANVRAGRHDCFDRLVVDIDNVGDTVGYQVRYVDEVVHEGSGKVVPLRGGARLQITFQAPAYDENGTPTYLPGNPKELVNVNRWDTFRQAGWAGSFEGQTTLGLGVRARLPYRVFVLDGPQDGARLVVDVAHRW